jgi:NTF2 fold immunity protein
VKILAMMSLSFSLAALVFGQTTPKQDYVPDAETALKIAEAVLIPVYGKSQIESERPFKAKLKDGIWTVTGTLHCLDENGHATTACVGGTAVVRLSKADAHIILLAHYK